MPRNYRILALVLVSVPLLGSCNVYRGFASPASDAEYIEEAQKCLVDRDYDCAITNYGRVSNATVKAEKLCIVNLAKAGLGISSLISIATNSGTGNDLLKDFAQALLPYTTTKEAAAEEAISKCTAMAASDTAQMLQALSYLVDCSVRIAKTDTLVATVNNGGATCNSTATGNSDGQITADDICVDGTGGITPTNPGMCEKDVLACATDVDNANNLSGGLGTAGLGGLASNIGTLATLVGQSGDAGRAIVRGFLQ